MCGPSLVKGGTLGCDSVPLALLATNELSLAVHLRSGAHSHPCWCVRQAHCDAALGAAPAQLAPAPSQRSQQRLTKQLPPDRETAAATRPAGAQRMV